MDTPQVSAPPAKENFFSFWSSSPRGYFYLFLVFLLALTLGIANTYFFFRPADLSLSGVSRTPGTHPIKAELSGTVSASARTPPDQKIPAPEKTAVLSQESKSLPTLENNPAAVIMNPKPPISRTPPQEYAFQPKPAMPLRYLPRIVDRASVINDTTFAAGELFPELPEATDQQFTVADKATHKVLPVLSRQLTKVPSLANTPESGEVKRPEPAVLAVESNSKNIHQIARLTSMIQQAVGERRHHDAENYLRELNGIKGNESLFAMKIKAYYLLNREQYSPAEELLEKVLMVDATDVEAALNLAILEVKTNRLKSARTRVRQLKRMYPTHERVLDLDKKLQ